MKSWSQLWAVVHPVVLLFAAAFLFSHAAHAKLVRLRNAAIPTRTDNGAQSTGARQSAVYGLFLVQFRHAPGPGAREQCAGLGLELLRYVPDDTFLARAHGVRLDRVRALPLVEWIGEYRPEHKVHRALRAKPAAPAGNDSIAVSILLQPRAHAAEIATARAFLTHVQQQSSLRSGTILRGRMNPNRLDALAASDAVLWVEPARDMKLFDEISSKIVAGDGGPHTLWTQSLGYDGSGVKVAVADSGLNNGDAATMHPDLLGRTTAFFHYGTLADAADEHSHGTHVAGIIAGNGATGEIDDNGYLYGLGVAPGAAIIAQRIFDAVGNYEPPLGFELLTRDAVRAGADIGSNSWGDDTQGRYDTSAMAFDELVRDADALTAGDQQYILEFSAGNAGPNPRTIGSPALGKNVIATGACENDREDFIIYADGIDTMADFSSRGPCEDGRVKPDVTAPGTWIASLQSASAGPDFAWAAISDNYQYQGGTSQAGPHVSGAAAVFVQYYRQTHNDATPSPALVKAALINSAYDMDSQFGTGPVPNGDEGWGRVDLPNLIDSGYAVEYLDQSVLLTNAQTFERSILVGSSEAPLNLTLTYTDTPGFPGAVTALNNDLDLDVIGPDGAIYRGNQLISAESVRNAAASDHINNVEAVRISTPIPGQYLIRVRASRVVEDAREDTPGLPDQDFALVISADLAPAGTAIISMDKRTYRAPAQIQLAVTDLDQSGRASVTVSVRSSTESSGVTVALAASAASGVFTGTVATAAGPAQPDGLLQVGDGDWIEAGYSDASSASTRISTAAADLRAPVLGSPTVQNGFGQVYISWSTDEPATSMVVYGPASAPGPPGFLASDATLTTNHTIVLGELAPGQTYSFYLVSADEAGNAGTNNDSGAFSFVVAGTPPILLVDQYTNYAGFLEPPPLSGYTIPLAQIGVPFDTWDMTTNTGPSLSVLSSYRVVIFRPSEIDDGQSPQTLNALSNYVQSGGSLLISSMEFPSRLKNPDFLHNVLHFDVATVDAGAPQILGSALDPVTSGIDIVMNYEPYHLVWDDIGIPADISDELTLMGGASALFRDLDGYPVGLRWPGLGQSGTGKVVYLGFPLDAIPAEQRADVLKRLLTFMAPGLPGLNSLTLDSAAYNLPGVVTVEAGDSGAAGRRSITVAASTTNELAPLVVTLTETAAPGRFRGSFGLIASTNAPVTGTLQASPGDSLLVRYTDSGGGLFSATARVDLTPPVIGNVTADPTYVSALISWESSEPADALVEYGQSALLDHSIYVGDFTEFPEVTLPFLQPDTVYYYRVTSRDQAGNSIRDDNQRRLYSFRTLRPIIPPWSDNMDSGAPGWSTFTDDSLGLGGSVPNWTLGVPHNELGTNNAPSLPNAWGCNLNGDFTDFAQCFLISPAIYLTNGNVARLTFSHNYDFADLTGNDIEIGEVDVVTEDGASTTLATYDDTSFGWEAEELDLSAWSGQIVYVVWYYFLFSMEAAPRPGWLVDDVSISTTTVPAGTVVISNNLWQATYVLSGGKYKKGKGSAVLTNAPPGQYVLEFADVPYYVTPPAQTNTLAPGGTLIFHGVYTFPDANGNGISDLWEQRFFGNVSAQRTGSTDSDADGMSDFAEFVAGTDPTHPVRVSLAAQRLPGGLLKLQWSTAPGQQYRVEGSTNLIAWGPYSAWIEATNTVIRLDVPIQPGVEASWFRVQVGATNSPAGMAPSLALSAQRLPTGIVQLQWASSFARAYRILVSTDLAGWMPLSDWLQATSTRMVFPLPLPTPGARQFYRLEVSP